MRGPTPDFQAILQELAQREVDFIIVGGVAAVLQGAPMATFDLDLVPSRHPVNLDRLVAALQALDAWYREHPARKLRPVASDLAGPGHHLLLTTVGPLDVLGTVTGGRVYEDLLPFIVEVEVALGVKVKVLDLPMLITLKEELGREKDQAVLSLLRRTLEERGRKGDSEG